MNYLDKTLNLLHQQGWSYGMVNYLNTAIGEEVFQIDAHQGDKWEKGRGSTWTEAGKDLVKKIYGIPGPGPILH
jgi:hypothetical protein